MRLCIFLIFCFFCFSGIAQISINEFRSLENDPYQQIIKSKRLTNLQSEKFIYSVKKKESNFRSDTIHIETYDELGNKVKRIAYEYNRPKYTQENTFCKKGNKTRAITRYHKKPKNVNVIVFTYNSDNNLKKIESLNLKEKDTISNSISKFTHKNNLLTSKEIYRGNRFVTGLHFDYDDKENMIYMHTGQKPEIGTYIEYIYNEKSQITEKLEYVKYINSDENFYLYKSKFMYNEAGKMVKDSVYSESKKHWTITDYKYNKNGLLSKINVKRNEYYENAIFVYRDKKLQKMKVTTNYNLSLKMWLNSYVYSAKMPAIYEEFYTYDKKGRIKNTKIYVNSELQAEYNRYISEL